MDLDPKSPFSDRTLSQLVGDHVREGDVWCAQLSGWGNLWQDNIGLWSGTDGLTKRWKYIPRYHCDWSAAGPLMAHGDWRIDWALISECHGFAVECQCEDGGRISGWCSGPMAIRNAFIVALSNKAAD